MNRQGGSKSDSINLVAMNIGLWAENHLLSLKAIYVRGKDYSDADHLSRMFLSLQDLALTSVTFSNLSPLLTNKFPNYFPTFLL